MKQAVREQLLQDKILGKLLQEVGEVEVERKKKKDYFQELYETIIFQQLSGKAAQSILRKFEALYPENKPTPEQVQKTTEEALASAGVSRQKRGYLYSLAEKFLDGTIQATAFEQLSDEEIIEELVQIKGIGRWSAQMFLLFTLGREDIFAPDDLGLRKALQEQLSLEELPKPKEAEELAEQWKPYRSYASLLLWKSRDKKE